MPAVLGRDTVFEEIKDAVRADDKGRVILGHKFSGKQFRVLVSADGDVLLTPVTTIPEREIWLYKNPEALMLFHKGLAEAAAGKVTPAEDFSQFANDDIGDE